ncbi:MAG: hypothetical protein WD249_00185 [Gaiellaceae bacterium]
MIQGKLTNQDLDTIAEWLKRGKELSPVLREAANAALLERGLNPLPPQTKSEPPA